MSKPLVTAALLAPPLLAVLAGTMAYDEYRALHHKEAIASELVLLAGELVLGIVLAAALRVSQRDGSGSPASLSVFATCVYVAVWTVVGLALIFFGIPSMS